MPISDEEFHDCYGWNTSITKKLLNKGKSRKMTIPKFTVERSQEYHLGKKEKKALD